MRDQRFVALHRGGLLDLASHRLLALWAADCAEHVLLLFTRAHPDDERPRLAIEATRAWACGNITVGQARTAAFRAHDAAREVSDAAARAAARAAGQAVSTAHMADHALGPVYYGVRAVKFAATAQDRQSAGEGEYRWQIEHLPDAVRQLVISALDEGTVLGNWRP
ncbi:MAG: putative immunity protein [Chloroflexales bacterium]